MLRGNLLINQLNAGEVSPLLDTRSDLDKYRSACRILEGMIPLVEGGATKGPGTYFVIATKDSSRKSREVKFHFSTEQAYTLEFGHKYIRFCKGKDEDQAEGQIVKTYSAWVTLTEYELGDLVTEDEGYYRCIVAHTSGTFSEDTLNWEETNGATDLAYEIPSPYDEDDLFQLDTETQSADTLFIFHESYPPKKLQRHDHDDWVLLDLCCLASADMAITGITKAALGVVTCTGHGFETDDLVYIQAVEGMVEVNGKTFTITVVDENSFSIGVSTSGYTTYTSGGTVTKRVFYEEGKYPACGTFYEQRLAVAGANDTPRQIDLSASADYENFIQDPEDDSAAISYTLDSKKVDRIWWMIGQEILVLGTSGGVWRFGSSSISEPVTAANVLAKKQVSIGVSRVQPQMVGESILWLTRSSRRLRNFVYNLDSDKWKAPDMTRIASHITKGDTVALSGIVDMDYQEEPIPILWMVRADGVLVGLTCEIDENVYAFFRIVTDGYFESVAVINQKNDEDQVWVTVRRELPDDPNPHRYIEFFKPHEFFSQIKDCFFVHSGLTWDGGDAVDITGITNDNPAVVTAPGHTFENEDEVRIKDVQGMTKINLGLKKAYTVDNVDGDTFELLNINSSVYPAWITETPYVIGDLVTQEDKYYQCQIDHTSGTFAGDLLAEKWQETTGWRVYTSGGTVQKVKKTLFGLNHLEGKEVVGLVDGASQGPKTVDTGSVTLDNYGNLNHIGLFYRAIAEPMKLHVGSELGTSKGEKQKISELTISFYETVSAKYGPDADHMRQIAFGTGEELKLFTGDKSGLDFEGNWDDEATMRIESDLPLPMTILAIIPKMNLSK